MLLTEYTRSVQVQARETNSSGMVEVGKKCQPERKIYWPLTASERVSIFFKSMATGKLTRLQTTDPHPTIFREHKLETIDL